MQNSMLNCGHIFPAQLATCHQYAEHSTSSFGAASEPKGQYISAPSVLSLPKLLPLIGRGNVIQAEHAEHRKLQQHMLLALLPR